jgi:hypothetical protein
MSESVGSAGEEALKLLRALGSSPSGRHAGDPSTGDERAHRCSTPWCPVCQVADFVRENPEAIAGVAASAGSMVTALRDLVDAAVRPQATEDDA